MNKVEEFIQRRFPNDNNWLSENCFFFATILKTVFGGTIVYDPVKSHFLLCLNDGYYDWAGKHNYTKEESSNFITWNICNWKNPTYWCHIVDEYIM